MIWVHFSIDYNNPIFGCIEKYIHFLGLMYFKHEIQEKGRVIWVAMIARAPNWQQICGSCEESNVYRDAHPSRKGKTKVDWWFVQTKDCENWMAKCQTLCCLERINYVQHWHEEATGALRCSLDCHVKTVAKEIDKIVNIAKQTAPVKSRSKRSLGSSYKTFFFQIHNTHALKFR